MSGQELMDTVVDGTGFHNEVQDLFQQELRGLIQKHGINIDNLSLEDLRMIVADYLQDVLLECKEHYK